MASVPPFQGVHLHHVARETSDVNRMVQFYQQVLGFEKLETPQSFGDFNVTWLRLPPIYSLHVVERDPKSRLPESPFVVPSDANADVSALWRGPHLSFRVSDYDGAINTLKTSNTLKRHSKMAKSSSASSLILMAMAWRLATACTVVEDALVAVVQFFPTQN